MRVKATRGHFVDGRSVAVGEVYETRDATARELIAIGKAEPAPAPDPVPAREPMPNAIKSPAPTKRQRFQEAEKS